MAPDFLRIAVSIVGRSGPQTPADAVLRMELKSQRDIPPEATGAISRAVFAYYRWRNWFPNRPLEQQLTQAIELQERFARRPSSFTDEELASKAVPAWVRDEMAFGPEWLRALQSEPRLWLRARPGHGNELMKKLGNLRLAGSGAGVSPASPGVSPALEASMPTQALGRRDACPTTLADSLEYLGQTDLFRTPEFHAGEFEIQDLSSQLVSLLCEPKPDETWWDACAGEGGKTLHLSDLMGNKGLIWASDRAGWRLQKLKRRAARAKVFNYRSAPWEGGAKLPTKTNFDGVLLDAPCSGLGTWQRKPHARWTTTPADVRELSQLQSQLLAHAVPAVKPGGKLIYAVCTVTRAETSEVARRFSERFPDFQPLPLVNPLQPNGAPTSTLWIWPQDSGGNGMFITAWRKG